MLIEAPQTPLFEALRQLTDSLRATAVAFTSDERRQVHAAAVIAGNFANHLWGIAAALLQPVQQPLRLLEPLLQETLRKAVLAKNPFQVQTGPAIRADEATLAAHLQLLQAQPEWEKVYQVLSASIQKTAILPKEE